jgi:hypothetical protein
MTHTLLGRWQIRVLSILTIGLLMTIAIAIKSGTIIAGQTLFTLIYLGIFGIGWDAVYHQLQRLRWDGDWNGLLQMAGAIWEGVFLMTSIRLIGLPGIDRAEFSNPGFIGFYTIFTLLNFLMANSLFRILLPYARFNGGQWF